MLDGAPVGNIGKQSLDEIWNSSDMQHLRRMHASGRAGEIDMCARCCASIPHPALVAGSLALNGKVVRRALPVVERLAARYMNPPGASAAPELVQIKVSSESAPSAAIPHDS
jgi:hypothetical protein